MSKTKVTRIYSPYTQEALAMLGKQIRIARKSRRQSAADLAARAGISRNTLLKIEQGHPKCEIGVTFEVAHLLGISLFDDTLARLRQHNQQADAQLRLLPKVARAKTLDIDDDF